MAGLKRRHFAALGLVSALPLRLWAATPSLAAAIAGAHRSPGNVARDRYRHPLAMLDFLGLRDDETVLEIEPGRGYWTEILAPYLQARGKYIAALPPMPAGAPNPFIGMLHADAKDYGKVVVAGLGGNAAMAPAGSVDMVLSFRNLHDWMADGTVAAKLAAIHAVLKPNGVLGMEDHRGLTSQPQDPGAKSGYVREDYAKKLIEGFGFKLVGSSGLGDNPLDTKDYPRGVWTLPPVLAMGPVDRDRYLAIGESDRWTMKFRKCVT